MSYTYKILKTLFKITLFCILTGIMLLIGTIFYLRQSPVAIAQYVSEAIAVTTNMSCQFSSVEILILPFPSLKISDLQLNDAQLDIFMESVTILPSITALLKGELKPYFIELMQPVLKVNVGLNPLFNNDKDNTNNKYNLDELKQIFNEKIADLKNHSLSIQKQIAGLNSFNVKIINANLYLSNNIKEVVQINALQANITVKEPSIIDGQISAKTILLSHNKQEFAKLEDININISDNVLALHQNLSASFEIQCKILIPNLLDLTKFNFYFEKNKSNKTALVQNQYDIQGSLFLAKMAMPIDISGEIEETTRGNFTLKNAIVSLDKDELEINAQISLPFFKANNAKTAKESFSIDGNITVNSFNLAQWFGFARMLPAGIQNNLHNLNGLINFNLNSTGLKIPKIIVNSDIIKFTGKGGLALWSKPLIQLTLSTQNINIHEVYPESIGIFKDELTFAHEPLVPISDDDNAKGISIDDINYDIALNFNSLNYSLLKAGKSNLRIKSTNNDNIVFMVNINSLYKGNAKATIELNASINSPISYLAVKAQLKNILLKEPSDVLKIKQKIAGNLSGNFVFKAQSQTINSFLSSLSGTGSIIIDDAIIQSTNKNEESLLFKKLEIHTKIKDSNNNLETIKAKTKTKNTKVKSINNKILIYHGDWKIIAENYLGHTTLGLVGPISIDYGKDMAISFKNIPLKLNLSLNKAIISTKRDLNAQITGIFSFNSSNKVLITKKYQLILENTKIIGNLQSNLSSNKFNLKSTLALNDKNFKNILNLWLDTKSIPKNTFKNTHISTQLSLNSQSLSLNNLYVNFDKTKINGLINVDFAVKPLLLINLAINNFNLDAYYPETSNKKSYYSDPVDLSILRKIDAKGILKFKDATIKKINFNTLSIPIMCSNSTLECSPINAKLYNTYASGIIRLIAKNQSTIQASFKATHADMLLFTTDQNYDILLGGKGSLDGIIQGDLSTTTSMLNSLSADVRFNIVNGFLQDKLKKGQTSRSHFKALLGSVALSKGILYNNDFKMLTNNTSITGKGWINLISQKIDYTAYVKVPLLNVINVQYHGDLANPKRDIKAGGAITSILGNIGSSIFHLTNRAFSSIFNLLAL